MSEIKKEEKASEFIDRHTAEVDGQKRFNILEAQIELFTRIKSALQGIKEINAALGDYGQFAIDMDNRMKKLEGLKTIEVVSPDQAKIILG